MRLREAHEEKAGQDAQAQGRRPCTGSSCLQLMLSHHRCTSLCQWREERLPNPPLVPSSCGGAQRCWKDINGSLHFHLLGPNRNRQFPLFCHGLVKIFGSPPLPTPGKILLLIVKKLLVFSSSFESRKSSFDPGLRRPSQYRHQSKMSSPKKLTCKETLRQVFIKVYRLAKQSACWYFIPSFVNCCPSYLLFSSAPPPLSPSLCE